MVVKPKKKDSIAPFPRKRPLLHFCDKIFHAKTKVFSKLDSYKFSEKKPKKLNNFAHSNIKGERQPFRIYPFEEFVHLPQDT